MHLDMRTVFVVLTGLYACLGLVCLFLPYRVKGSHAVTYWGYGMLLLAAGTGGIGLRGIAPDILSIAVANALLLLAFMFIRDAAHGAGRLRADWSGWSVAGAAILLILYFTAVQPDTQIRIVVFSLSAAALAVRPALALIAAVPGQAGRAKRFTSACFLGIGLVMLARAALSTKWGANADLLSPSAVQAETILLVGVFVVASTLGVLWIEIEQLQAELTLLAMLDPLTGTLNRRAFMHEYERELSRCIRDKSGFALALFDLDNFKLVNDTHGHAIGDQVLCRAVDALRANLRGHDVLGRYGGEEFALLLPGTDKAGAMLAAERARHGLGERPVEAGSLSIPISVSAGVAAYGIDGTDWESLVSGADKALYEAKRGGKNRVVAARGPA
jgi:diguanylate cyclase (GGDEF)-like protein